MLGSRDKRVSEKMPKSGNYTSFWKLQDCTIAVHTRQPQTQKAFSCRTVWAVLPCWALFPVESAESLPSSLALSIITVTFPAALHSSNCKSECANDDAWVEPGFPDLNTAGRTALFFYQQPHPGIPEKSAFSHLLFFQLLLF